MCYECAQCAYFNMLLKWMDRKMNDSIVSLLLRIATVLCLCSSRSKHDWRSCVFAPPEMRCANLPPPYYSTSGSWQGGVAHGWQQCYMIVMATYKSRTPLSWASVKQEQRPLTFMCSPMWVVCVACAVWSVPVLDQHLYCLYGAQPLLNNPSILPLSLIAAASSFLLN